MREFNVAIVGATGAVGTELISLLKERSYPVKSLKLLASSRSAGKQVDTPMAFHRGEATCTPLGAESPSSARAGLCQRNSHRRP